MSSPRFHELVSLSSPPDGAQPAVRRAVAADVHGPVMSDDVRNNGFVAGLSDARRSNRMRATRRGFLRSSLVAASAATAASFAGLFGPARRVEAQTGIVGTYPRRIATWCPPLNSNDNCQPGCGSSPICTDCCSSDGYFRNDPANGYSLYAGGCGDGDIADGWLWRFNGVCGSCGTIEYRCSDGYVQTDTGPAPFICRAVTACEPLPEGAEPGEALPDAARDTNWRPAGRIELASDNGGTLTVRGWISDGSDTPVSMRIVANGTIVHFGTAALPRPDIAQTVRGTGPNTGFAVSFPVEPGDYKICVDALATGVNASMGCVNLRAGSGAAVRGSGGSASLPSAPEPTPAATATPSATSDTPTAEPTAEPTATPEVGEIVFPQGSSPSDALPWGAVQVLRRSSATTAFISGWAADVDTDEPVLIDVLIDGESVGRARTELPRPDVAATFGEFGPETGFALTADIPAESVKVCVYVVDPEDGRRHGLGCRTLGAAITDEGDDDAVRPSTSGDPSPKPTMVYGAIDNVEVSGSSVIVSGWAFSSDRSDETVTISLTAAGVTRTAAADRDHEAAADVYGVTYPAGFEVSATLPSGEHLMRLSASSPSSGQRTIAEQTVVIP